MDNKIALGVISVFVVLVVIGSALTPMIDAYTTTTTTIENEGAVGLRMDKVTSGDFTLNYGLVGDDFTATNGTDTQIIDDMCIFYADDNVAVWMDDSSVRLVGKDANDQTIDAALSDEATITITKSASGVNITDGTVDQTFPVPAWSYVPKSTGAYGFFLNETEINTGGLDVHYVGSFAGVNCYDSINTYDLPITVDATVTDSTLTGAKWIKAAADPETEITPLEPGSLTPLDPGVINLDPEPDTSIMAVPTPTYTDGDWGYDLSNDVATIVSYSGEGNKTITVPATIGGYVVTTLGKGTNYNVFPTTLTDYSVIISDGITKLSRHAFVGCTGLKSVTIPASVTTITREAFLNCTDLTTVNMLCQISTLLGGLFENCTSLTDVNLPSSIKQLDYTVFKNCTSLKSIYLPNLETINATSTQDGPFTGCTSLSSFIIPESMVSLSALTFKDTTSLKEVLNLSDIEVTTTSYGLNADEVRSDIPALGYLALAEYNETVTDDSPMAALLKVIPLITIIAVVTMAVGVFIARRME